MCWYSQIFFGSLGPIEVILVPLSSCSLLAMETYLQSNEAAKKCIDERGWAPMIDLLKICDVHFPWPYNMISVGFPWNFY